MQLDMEIKNIKFIKQFCFSFPLEAGIYAITGENGAGKSTLISCASTIFFQMPMNEFFGHPCDASMVFKLGDASRSWMCNGRTWSKDSKGMMEINGFYEGSVIFGNRFRDTRINIINQLDKVNESELYVASSFLKRNLGLILHNDENVYQNLYTLKKESADKLKLTRATFFIKTSEGELISQPRMSTGENLLISVLNSLAIVSKKRKNNKDGRPYVVFLDEIELALHSSALRRLIVFLKDVSMDLGLTVFFSTHSIDLLREIRAQNIYYLANYGDGTITVTNPCYPAYATRNLYGEDGYGNDLVILVEDDLAKLIIERILIDKSIARNIRIKILPTGGWTNTIMMAHDVTTSNLLQKGTKLAVILDGDIKKEMPSFISSHKHLSGIKVDYLPIASLEKYLLNRLALSLDNQLYEILDTYLFQKRPLKELINQYRREVQGNDPDGKKLYGYLINEIRSMRKNREDLVEIVVKYVMGTELEKVQRLEDYIRNKIGE